MPLLARACHPEPTLAVTTLTALLAVDAGHPVSTCILVTSAVFTGQLSIGWSNDLIDAARDRTVQRTAKPLASGALDPRVVRLALAVVLPLCVLLSLLCGLPSGLTHLVLGVGSGWAYNLWFKRLWWSWLPYAVAFGSLPAVVWLANSPSNFPPVWLMAAAALLGVGAHLVNAIPDLAEDATTGVHGFPHRLGSKNAQRAAAGLLVAASGVVALAAGYDPPVWVWAALGVVVVLAAIALRTSGRLAFRATIAIALIDVVMLLAR